MKNKNVEDFYPLTPLQSGMLFHSLAESEDGIYIEQFKCIISGQFNVEAFKEAWNNILRNHQILRSSFIYENIKEPIQVVHRKIELNFKEISLENLGKKDKNRRVEKILNSEVSEGFDFSRPPLMKFLIIKLSKNKVQFVWTYHHILLDGWSIPLIINEIFIYYSKIVSNQNLVIEKPKQFKEYIIWLKSQDGQKAERYWKEKLKGFTNPTSLSFDGYQSNDKISVFLEKEIWIEKEKTSAISEFCKSQNITINTIVQAAWAFLLGKYTNENDVLFGATVSGRSPDLEGVENMVGMFINTLPIRVTLDYQDNVDEYLKELQKTQIEVREYEYSSLIDIHRFSDIPADKTMFDSIVVFENYPVSSVQDNVNGNLSIEGADILEKTNFPINLIAGVSDRLFFKLVYESNKYSPEFIERMLNHLVSVIENFRLTPTEKLAGISYISDEEKKYLLQLNNNKYDFDCRETLHSLFEETAAKFPASTAIVYGDIKLTYTELNHRANRLAHFLISKGVNKESLVGLFIEKSDQMIVSILAILKAGGAYVPIDPSYPENRIRLMIKEAELSIIISQSHLLEQIDDSNDKNNIIDISSTDLSNYSDKNPSTEVNTDNLAYIIFTSGSTGIPKGTMLPHRGVVNFIQNMILYFNIDRNSKIAQFSSISFDASVLEIFPAIISGGELVIPSGSTNLSDEEILDLIVTNGINLALFTPAILDLIDSKKLSKDVSIISGGEKLSWEIANKWKDACNFFNAYGPTETSIACLWDNVIENKFYTKSVPIGTNLRNVSVYLLDNNFHQVPLGIVGEIFISQKGVGRGYLNKPELTAEKFLPDPYSYIPGARMYRTGDLAKLLPDGKIVYIRRSDTQVKLRGFRIELQEIEKVINRHPLIESSIVDIEESKKGEKSLVAYFIARSNSEISSKEIRDFIIRELPHYMVPSNIIKVKEWPLLPNGKIDYKSLSLSSDNKTEDRNNYLAPRTKYEIELVGIWKELLGKDLIGVYDNFFELGGHSLLAIRLLGIIKKKYDIELSLAEVFREPTVHRLAQNMTDYKNNKNESLMIPLKEGTSDKAVFFIHPSGGSVHWYTKLAKLTITDMPLYGIQAKGTVGDNKLLDDNIEEMATRYIEEILRIQPSGPFFLVGWSFGAIVAYEIAQKLVKLNHEIGALIIFDQGLFELTEEPDDQAERLMTTFKKYFALSLDDLRALDEHEQLKYVFKLAKRNRVIPFWIKFKDFNRYLEILKTQQNAWRKYEIKKYEGKIILFKAEDDPDSLDKSYDFDWAKITAEKPEIISVPGDHISMLLPPNVYQLAKHFSNLLSELTISTEIEN